MIDEKQEYFAFISYKREDEKWAKWLQHKLEHYKLPSTIKKRNTTFPKNLRPVFKDTSELASGVLADEIYIALKNSRYLIVICSPRAAQSEWVCKEVQTFIDLGRTKKIIPFIIGGKAFAEKPEEECFPTALLQLPSEQELLGININDMGKEAAVIKVIAQMLGLKFDTLWQRHQKEKARRTTILIAVAVFLVTVLSTSVWIWQKNIQLQQSNLKIKEAQSRFIAEKIKTLIDEGDSYTAILLALETLPKNLENPDRPYVPESELALRQVAFRHSAFFRAPSGTTPQDVSFSQDGKRLLALMSDSTIQAWDAMTGGVLDTLVSYPYNHPIKKLGKREVAIFEEFGIKITHSDEAMWKRSWTEPDDSIAVVAVSSDQKLMASASRDMHLRIWNFHTGKMIDCVKAHDASIRFVAFSPDNIHIATASTDGTAKIWERTLKQKPIVLKGHQAKVYSVVFSPDGEKLLTASEDQTLKLWNAHSGTLIGTFLGHTNSIHYAAFSPDKKYIVSASYDKSIKVWDAQSLDSVSTLYGHKGSVCSAQFSPDGKTIASVSWDNTVKLWDVRTKTIIREWEAHHRGIHSVCFSPDGKQLMTASWENTAKIWDVSTGRLVHELIGHTKNITSASFVADGTQIVTSSTDGTIKVWDFLPLQALINQKREEFKNRQLTREEREKYYLE